MQGEVTKQQSSGPDNVAYLGKGTVRQRIRGSYVTLLAAIKSFSTKHREHLCSPRLVRLTLSTASITSIHYSGVTKRKRLFKSSTF
jgi:hypothetical protein